MSISIGIDPDCEAHGVAIFINGNLDTLKSMTLVELMSVFKDLEHKNPVVHIENVCAQNAAFKKKYVKNAAASTAISRTLGMCQQAQVEVERMANYYGIKVVRHKISSAWKDASIGRKTFETATGWKLRSNKDTRSAAYFGYLGAHE